MQFAYTKDHQAHFSPYHQVNIRKVFGYFDIIRLLL